MTPSDIEALLKEAALPNTNATPGIRTWYDVAQDLAAALRACAEDAVLARELLESSKQVEGWLLGDPARLDRWHLAIAKFDAARREGRG